MAYYVDTGTNLVEEDTLDEALEQARHAMASAKTFKDRMGFWPYWARATEVRKGKSMIGTDWNQFANEQRNKDIVAATKEVARWTKERDAFIANN